MLIYPQLNLNIQRFATTASGDYVQSKTKAADMGSYGFLVLGGALDLNTAVKLPDFISSCRLGHGLGTNWDGSLVKVNDLDPRTHNFLRYGREIQTSIIRWWDSASGSLTTPSAWAPAQACPSQARRGAIADPAHGGP